MSLLTSLAAHPSQKLTAPFPSGVYWDFGSGSPGTLGASAISASTIYAQKLAIPRGLVTSRVFCEITVAAAAGKLVRVGLATVGGNGFPDALIYDTGSLAADTTGDVGQNVVLTLPYDEVWSYVLSDGTPTLRAYVTSVTPAFMGWRNATDTTKDTTLLKTQAFGALPASFGAPTSYGNVPLRAGVKS